MNEDHAMRYAYGLWPLVLINVALFTGFLLSFAKPGTKVEWRSFGLFTSFIVALFVEMYGIPLTIYLLVSWLGSRYPAADPFSHSSGHLLSVFLGIRSGHGSILHFLSNALIFIGGILIMQGWAVVHAAKTGVAERGVYAYVRHPQYLGFISVIVGFLVQWPTLVTLFMAPVLIVRYVLLARREEREMLSKYPKEYTAYMERVQAWMPAPRWCKMK